MVGFVLPFYLQDILHLSPSFMGFLFMSAPVFTVTLSPAAGWVADKVGPRLPSTAGILFLVIAAFIGGFLRADSHWTSAVVVLALWGLATALFLSTQSRGYDRLGSRANIAAWLPGPYMSCSVLGAHLGYRWVRYYLPRRFAITAATRLATPTPANPAVFVSAMNFTFFVAGIMGLMAMACSAMRGKKKSR